MSANEFGRLANGVGGHIKGTNTIKIIHKRGVPSKQMKDVTYGKLYAASALRKPNHIERVLLLVATKLTTRAK